MMKVVILAGGLGTRITEESVFRPKPMIEIGEKPILWHVMKIYSAHGFNEFIICCGYKAFMIKEYFANYFLHTSDMTFDIKNNCMEVHRRYADPWKVTVVDTGIDTQTGGRLKRVLPYIDSDTFCMTYGDGVGDVDITKLVEYHQSHKHDATLTAVTPPGRFGSVNMDKQGKVVSFSEKTDSDGGWINAGFLVLNTKLIENIKGDDTSFEFNYLPEISKLGQLMVYKHHNFWRCMDTMRDKHILDELWASGKAPWKVW